MLSADSWNYFERCEHGWKANPKPILAWNDTENAILAHQEYSEGKDFEYAVSLDAAIGEGGQTMHDILSDDEDDFDIVGRY